MHKVTVREPPLGCLGRYRLAVRVEHHRAVDAARDRWTGVHLELALKRPAESVEMDHVQAHAASHRSAATSVPRELFGVTVTARIGRADVTQESRS